jgi:hypothetical protein
MEPEMQTTENTSDIRPLMNTDLDQVNGGLLWLAAVYCFTAAGTVGMVGGFLYEESRGTLNGPLQAR